MWVVVKIMFFFFGYPKYPVPYYNRDAKKKHNFENHSCDLGILPRWQLVGQNARERAQVSRPTSGDQCQQGSKRLFWPCSAAGVPERRGGAVNDHNDMRHGRARLQCTCYSRMRRFPCRAAIYPPFSGVGNEPPEPKGEEPGHKRISWFTAFGLNDGMRKPPEDQAYLNSSAHHTFVKGSGALTSGLVQLAERMPIP